MPIVGRASETSREMTYGYQWDLGLGLRPSSKRNHFLTKGIFVRENDSLSLAGFMKEARNNVINHFLTKAARQRETTFWRRAFVRKFRPLVWVFRQYIEFVRFEFFLYITGLVWIRGILTCTLTSPSFSYKARQGSRGCELPAGQYWS